MKRDTIDWLLIVALVFNCTMNIMSTKELKQQKENSYPIAAKVTHLDYENDIIYITEPNGNTWTFSECENWAEGDNVACIMDSKGTEDVTDDVIKTVKYVD